MSAVDLAITILFILGVAGVVYWLINTQINDIVARVNESMTSINQELNSLHYRAIALETAVTRMMDAKSGPKSVSTVRPMVPGKPIPPRNPDPNGPKR